MALSGAREFVVNNARQYDQSSPRNWIFSHLIHYKLFISLFLIGALGNAGLAFAVPAFIGAAFTVVLAPHPDLHYIGMLALVLLGTQLLRAMLQFSRNGNAELLGLLLERDCREELYAN